MKKKLSAFSMIEILVGMVISSIVIASAYFVYGYFSNNLVNYKRHIDNLGDATVLNGILSHDMNLAKTVRKNTSNDFTLDQNNKSIEYQLKEDLILRITEASTDTFHLPVKNLELDFMGSEQVVSGGLVDELKFTSTADGRELMFYFEKGYGSDILVETENKPNGSY